MCSHPRHSGQGRDRIALSGYYWVGWWFILRLSTDNQFGGLMQQQMMVRGFYRWPCSLLISRCKMMSDSLPSSVYFFQPTKESSKNSAIAQCHHYSCQEVAQCHRECIFDDEVCPWHIGSQCNTQGNEEEVGNWMLQADGNKGGNRGPEAQDLARNGCSRVGTEGRNAHQPAYCWGYVRKVFDCAIMCVKCARVSAYC